MRGGQRSRATVPAGGSEGAADHRDAEIGALRQVHVGSLLRGEAVGRVDHRDAEEDAAAVEAERARATGEDAIARALLRGRLGVRVALRRLAGLARVLLAGRPAAGVGARVV